jgi:hypothetical protein
MHYYVAEYGPVTGTRFQKGRETMGFSEYTLHGISRNCDKLRRSMLCMRNSKLVRDNNNNDNIAMGQNVSYTVCQPSSRLLRQPWPNFEPMNSRIHIQCVLDEQVCFRKKEERVNSLHCVDTSLISTVNSDHHNKCTRKCTTLQQMDAG